jgi:hypothetical protein
LRPIGGGGEVMLNDGTRVAAAPLQRGSSLISILERDEIRPLPMGIGPRHITVARLRMSVIAAVKAAQ